MIYDFFKRNAGKTESTGKFPFKQDPKKRKCFISLSSCPKVQEEARITKPLIVAKIGTKSTIQKIHTRYQQQNQEFI